MKWISLTGKEQDEYISTYFCEGDDSYQQVMGFIQTLQEGGEVHVTRQIIGKHFDSLTDEEQREFIQKEEPVEKTTEDSK